MRTTKLSTNHILFIVILLNLFSQSNYAQLNSEAQRTEVTITAVKKEPETPHYENKLTKVESEFIIACHNGDVQKVKYALDEDKVNIYTVDSELNSGLLRASVTGKIEVVNFFLERNFPVNYQNRKGYTALIYASSEKHPEIVQVLLAHQADVNIGAEEGGMTALLVAVFNSDYAMTEILLKAGADPNKPTLYKEQNTVLKFATDPNIKKLLKRYNAR